MIDLQRFIRNEGALNLFDRMADRIPQNCEGDEYMSVKFTLRRGYKPIRLINVHYVEAQ